MIEHDINQQDWISPPCDTITDALEERGWSHAEFARRMDMTPKHINELLKNRVAITAPLAEKLALVIGSTPDFWLRKQINYDTRKQRQQERVTQAGMDTTWLAQLPIKWLRSLMHVDDSKDETSLILQCLSFFGVANHDAWQRSYGEPLVAFRTSAAHEQSVGAVAAWLRAAELEAMGELPDYDEATFRAAIKALRGCTDAPDLSAALTTIQTRCAAAGVAVVLVPAPPKCPVSGATKWINPHRALIVLTDRYKRDDTFWFTFFHEAAHILKHKKALIVEGTGGGLNEELEAEANEFARDLLITPAQFAQLSALADGRLSKEQVRDFAEAIGVAPGIVVGRLQHHELLPKTDMNGLKRAYTYTPAAS